MKKKTFSPIGYPYLTRTSAREYKYCLISSGTGFLEDGKRTGYLGFSSTYENAVKLQMKWLSIYPNAVVVPVEEVIKPSKIK
jgi:hypothetical protein